MAPEEHGAQGLPDPDLGPKRLPTPIKSGGLCNFCFIKFLPKFTVEAPEAPLTPFTYPVPRGIGMTPQEPSCPQGIHLCQISLQSVQQFGFL